jgi:hypothetical protein
VTPFVRLLLGRYGAVRRVLPNSAVGDSARGMPLEVGRKWLGVQGLQTCCQSLRALPRAGAQMGADSSRKICSTTQAPATAPPNRPQSPPRPCACPS